MLYNFVSNKCIHTSHSILKYIFFVVQVRFFLFNLNDTFYPTELYNANEIVIIYLCVAQWYWIFKFVFDVINRTHNRISHVICDRYINGHSALVVENTGMNIGHTGNK